MEEGDPLITRATRWSTQTRPDVKWRGPREASGACKVMEENKDMK
jgi:hypothetical protein